MADALHKGCDNIVTCGGIQSNHARATAVAAAQLGLKAHLVLRWRGPIVSIIQCNNIILAIINLGFSNLALKLPALSPHFLFTAVCRFGSLEKRLCFFYPWRMCKGL